MSASGAEEEVAYCKLVTEEGLGIRGVQLTPDREVTEEDLDRLLPNHRNLEKEIVAAYLEAHRKCVAELFRPPAEPNAVFNYPFIQRSREGGLTDQRVRADFYRAITAVPGKARHEGFYMAVLGRFGGQWPSTPLKIIEMVFIARYIPTKYKQMTRVPIPKPGRPDEYRPLSLCDDIFCFVNGIVAQRTS